LVGTEHSGTGPFEGPPTIKPPALPEDTYFWASWKSLSKRDDSDDGDEADRHKHQGNRMKKRRRFPGGYRRYFP
jgi:hypothetical protein